MELESPHFADKAPINVHQLMIMVDLVDGVRSFAIDSFPNMSPSAIEDFWQRKIEADKQKRAVTFSKLEHQYRKWREGAAGDTITGASGDHDGRGAKANDSYDGSDAAASQESSNSGKFRWITNEQFLESRNADHAKDAVVEVAVAADGAMANEL